MRQILAFAFLVLLAPAAHAQFGPATVGVVKVEKRPIVETNQFVGRVQAIDRVNLVARVTAFLEQRMFTEGAEVEKGTVLYKLERGPFEADAQAKAAMVAQNQALLRNTAVTLNRATSLLSTPAGQQSNVDAALANQGSQAAQMAQAQAQLKASQINLDYTEIRAPVAGKITLTNVTEGNVVGPSSGTLATIVSQDPMYVLFPVAVRTAAELRDKYATKGGLAAVTVKVKLPTGAMYAQTGQLDYVDPTVSANTDTLVFRAKIPNPPLPGIPLGSPGSRELVDGEFVNAIIEAVEPVPALAIPLAAVMSDQQGNSVYVVGADDKLEARRIKLGQSSLDTASVLDGLKEGETVVVQGLALPAVRPGAQVKTFPLGASPGGPGGAATPKPAAS